MSYSNPVPDRRFEQFLVLVFLSLPPIGGLMVLWNALKNPPMFWQTVGWIAYVALTIGAHIKWVRPFFRRFPVVATYKELSSRAKPLSARHPGPVRKAWTNRIMRSAYRLAFTALLAPGFVALYQLHGHHFIWFIVGYAVCGLGITVGYHRIGTHPSFKAPAWVKFILLAMGSMAMQGPAAEWLKKHSKHHAFGETTADPHSPYIFDETKRGIFKEQVWSFLHSFVMWAFREPALTRPKHLSVEEWKENLLANPPDMAKFKFRDEDAYHWEVRDENGTVIVTTESLVKKRWAKLVDTIINIENDKVVQLVSNPVVYLVLLGISIFGPTFFGISAWESLARLLFLSWVTFCVNSVCHLWGEQPFVTPDNSRNNAVIEILALGEGGHNTHHKAALWARHGIFAWQWDIAAHFIKFLTVVGLASDMKLPTKQQIVRSWVQWRQREPDMQGYSSPSPVPPSAVAEAA